MKTIGLLGGMSWESTATYYRLINQLTRVNRGRFHSAPLLMWSADFEEIRRLQQEGHWDRAADILAAAAHRLESAGAHLLLLCTNTMHKVAAAIEEAVSIPLLHRADCGTDQTLWCETCSLSRHPLLNGRGLLYGAAHS